MPQQRLSVASALLVSDVHLSIETPQLQDHFCRWIRAHTAQPAAPDVLIILGDLFDAWVGDDVMHDTTHGACGRTVAQTLEAIAGSGVRVALMHGNRDFLIGEAFAAACHADLLTDPTVLAVGNGPTIAITHGDQLCTADAPYQQFRNQVRSSAWQQAFLTKPLAERLAVAQSLREQSEHEKSGKSMQIMDITPHDGELLIDRLGADLLLHGHTHRPGCNTLPNGKMRWVLPDWDLDAQGGLSHGGGLWIDAQGVRVVPA